MLNQMFTADNFRIIFDLENRKGTDLVTLYFPEFLDITFSIKQKVTDIRAFKKTKSSIRADVYEIGITRLKNQLSKLKTEKSDKIDIRLIELSGKVLKSNFKIDLTEKVGPKGKKIYCIDGSPETFFVVKQLQSNIRQLYKVTPSNRHELVSQLKDVLESKFPFEIVRTDISSFYETIDRKKLVRKIDEDHLLSSSSKKFIKQILADYEKKSDSPIGIPRGVGVSAYLAELFLRPIDREIKKTPGLALYARYVDDIIAVIARPSAGQMLVSYEDHIIKVISDRNLEHNADKTFSFSLTNENRKKFEFLGYRYIVNKAECRIWPSSSKVKKYQKRLKISFASYRIESSTNPRQAYRNLVARIKFLTGNTRLLNSKSAATVGVYYNNPLISEISSFTLLDKLLRTEINKIKRKKLRKRLKQYSFSSGFETRRYHKFTTKELANIVKVWKYA